MSVQLSSLKRTLLKTKVFEHLKKTMDHQTAAHLYTETCHDIKKLIDEDLCYLSDKSRWELDATICARKIFEIIPSIHTFCFCVFGYTTDNEKYVSTPDKSWYIWSNKENVYFFNSFMNPGAIIFDDYLYDTNLNMFKIKIPPPTDPFNWYDIYEGRWVLWASKRNGGIYINCKRIDD